MTTLQGRGLGYRRGDRRIFAGVDLDVAPGDRIALMGASGSGKTTLIAVLAGLEAATEGDLRIDGRPVRPGHRAATGPQIAIIPQTYGLVSLLTAAENVEAALRAAGRPAAEAVALARDTLDSLGLAGLSDQLIEELSGGQQQRVAVARALARRPNILFADECTSEQDPESRALLLGRLFEIRQSGAALVLATHDPDVARRCDRVVTLTSAEDPEHASAAPPAPANRPDPAGRMDAPTPGSAG